MSNVETIQNAVNIYTGDGRKNERTEKNLPEHFILWEFISTSRWFVLFHSLKRIITFGCTKISIKRETIACFLSNAVRDVTIATCKKLNIGSGS
jgi:hypothetical protein